MKKATQQTSTTQPMGIVITTGAHAPIEPLVRAYVWGPPADEFDPRVSNHSEKTQVG